MVGEDAVLQREAALTGQRGRVARGEQAQGELDVPEQAALFAAGDLGAVGELAGAAEVVQERGGEQQVAVEAGVQGAELQREGGDGDGVLEQPAEVGVVAGGARRGRARLEGIEQGARRISARSSRSPRTRSSRARSPGS